MNERIVVAKFGGTSVADAAQFRKIREIVQSGPERRFIVVSAPGKRFPEDRKVTDLLLDCYEKAAAGESYEEEFRQIRARFREIIDGLRLSFPLDEELEPLKQSEAGRDSGLHRQQRGISHCQDHGKISRFYFR